MIVLGKPEFILKMIHPLIRHGKKLTFRRVGDNCQPATIVNLCTKFSNFSKTNPISKKSDSNFS
jgi:hypothetical protein